MFVLDIRRFYKQEFIIEFKNHKRLKSLNEIGNKENLKKK